MAAAHSTLPAVIAALCPIVLVSNNSNAQEYLQAFIRWNQVAADLQKIVSEAMSQGMDVLELDK